MRFRQYIPVKTTSGGSNPDPSVYCPANGYIPDPEVLHPEFPLPEATVESITFICNAVTSNWQGATREMRIGIDGASERLYELFDTDGNLLNSWTSTPDFMDFNFPTNDRYYVVKVSVTNGIIEHYYNNTNSVSPYNDCIEAAIFNTPNIKGISFIGNLNFKQVEFKCSLDNLLSLYEFAKYCINFTHFKFPQNNFPMLQRLDAMFEGSGIQKIDLRNIVAPNLDYINGMAKDCLYLSEFHFMPTCNAKRAYDVLYNTPRLAKFTMYTSAPNLGLGFTSTGLMRMFQNSSLEGEITVPENTYGTSISSMFYGCDFLTKIKFVGHWPQLSNGTNALAYCPGLIEAEMPRTVKPTAQITSVFNSSTSALEIYKGPDIGYIAFPVSSKLVSITGDHDTSGYSSHPYVSVYTGARNTLATFNCPKLRCSRFLFSTSSYSKFALITSLEIDWANSDWSSTYTPTISIVAAIDSTEINRILTALPIVTGKTIDVRYCDGYATCDPSIATAKGWTVL
jgi:hypothetical protein